jgi:hypothetical protein
MVCGSTPATVWTCAWRNAFWLKTTVDTIQPIHQAQLLTYLKLSGCALGFLVNWKVVRIKDGIRRMIWTHKT